MEQSHAGIWEYYGLHPQYTENFGRVQKLYTDQGNYALKKIPAGHGMDFLHSMQRLYQSGYHRFVPVFPALDGRYGILQGKSIYYLMPWIEGGDQRETILKEEQMLREVARLHVLSSREIPIKPEDRMDHYKRTKDEWERQKEIIEQYVTLAENEIYMSPFSLLFCLYFQDIQLAYRFAINKLAGWIEETKEQDKTRTVQIHGQLVPDHFILDHFGKGYFINLERSRLATPIHDLVPFFTQSLTTYPKKAHTETLLLEDYLKYFPLKKEEKLLFQSYLAYPGGIFQMIATYYARTHKYSEIQMTKRLQQQYWQMKNIEFFLTGLETSLANWTN